MFKSFIYYLSLTLSLFVLTKSKIVGLYAMDTVAMALNIVYNTNNYKDAILKSVNLGGDADSIAGVVGMLCGAIYGYTE